jgi:hypothetical protein
MKNLIILILILMTISMSATAGPMVSFGLPQYVDFGYRGDGLYRFHSGEDYYMVSASYYLTDELSVGLGYGSFEYNFSETDPAPGEYQGFDDKDSHDNTFAIIIDYSRKWFFINTVIAQPEHEINQDRIIERGFPPTLDSRTETENGIDYFVSAGVRWEF